MNKIAFYFITAIKNRTFSVSEGQTYNFSLAKRKCGMGLVTAKPRETVAHVNAMSILVLNLRKIQCAFWELLTYLLAIFMAVEKWAIVQ